MRRPGMLGNEEGMALVIVLAVVSVLLAAALSLARISGDKAMATGAETDRFLAGEQALSGIHLAMALLAEDGAGSEMDSLQEDWARPEMLAEVLAAAGLNPESQTLEIRDELGLIQINSLMKTFPGHEANGDQLRLWEAFFNTLTHEAQGLVNALKDWLDSRDDGTVTGLSGAESDYYLSFDVPYTCADAPFTHISEIFLVKGVTRELFGEIDPEALITVNGLDREASGSGRARYGGRVNVNTAPAEVLRILLDAAGEMGDRAEELVEYREAREGDVFIHSLDRGWVGQVIELAAEEKAALDRLIRYDSDLFRIGSRAKVNHAGAGVRALVIREKDGISGRWSCRIVALERQE